MSVSEIFFNDMWSQLSTEQANSFLVWYLQKESKRKREAKETERKEDFSNATLNELLAALADRRKNLQLEDELEIRYAAWLKEIQKHDFDLLPQKYRDWLNQASGELPPGKKTEVKLTRVLYKQLQEKLEKCQKTFSESERTELTDTLRGIVRDAAALRDKNDESKKRKEDLSNATLDELLAVLSDRNKKIQLEDKLETRYTAWLKELQKHNPDVLPQGCRDWLNQASGELPPGKKTKVKLTRMLYKELQERLEKYQKAFSESEWTELTDTLRGIVLDAAAVQEAWDFLYNSGFGRKKKDLQDETGEKTERVTNLDRIRPHDGRIVRKEDHMLHMLDEWCVKRKYALVLDGVSGSSELTNEDREEWKNLFQALQTYANETEDQMEKVKKLILPVQIDPNTGVGLYLVGIGNLMDSGLVNQLQDEGLFCIFLCFCPDEFTDASTDDLNSVFISLTVPDMDENRYEVSFEQAEQSFFNCKNNAKNAYSLFRDKNGLLPSDIPIPRKLHRYFKQEEEQEEMDYQTLVDEGKKKSKEEEKRHEERETRKHKDGWKAVHWI